jgi:hypothetical protein
MIARYMETATTLLVKEQQLKQEFEELEQRRRELEQEKYIFIQELEDMGIQSVTLLDGSKLEIKEVYHCSINRDNSNVAEWLRENGGSDLVQSELKVHADDKEKLRQSGIDYAEEVRMNTLKVKAWVKSQLGITGGHQNIQITDLPKGLHFYIEKRLEV